MPHKRHPVSFNAEGEPSRKLRHKLPARPGRANKRDDAREVMLRQFNKERKIGVDPLFRNNMLDKRSASAAWRKVERAYDEAHRA